MPNFKSISFKMAVLQGAGRICPPDVCVIQKTPCGIGLMDDSNLTMKEKIIHLQRVTDDVTRRKIHFASLQGQFLQSCFDRSTKVYDETLKEVKIKKWWALYLCTALYLFVLFTIT